MNRQLLILKSSLPFWVKNRFFASSVWTLFAKSCPLLKIESVPPSPKFTQTQWNRNLRFPMRLRSCATDTTKYCSPFYCVFNSTSFNLFHVYAQSVNDELYHTIDDQLDLMQDYGVVPRYMTKDDVITCFNHIAEKRNDNSKIKTANYLKYPLSSFYSVATKPLLNVSAESHSPFTPTQRSPRQMILLETKSLPSSKHGI